MDQLIPNKLPIKLIVFDVAGTTAQDDGLVVEAFRRAMIALGVEDNSPKLQEMINYVDATMGQRKIDVFTHLCEGDINKANQAHNLFIDNYVTLIEEGKLQEFPGIKKLFNDLSARGITLAITTGFPRVILDKIIFALDWKDYINFSVAASEVEKGRPAPDMIMKSIELYNQVFSPNISPENIVVVGDTESDIQSGLAAGAQMVVGVETGAHTKDQLSKVGATHILNQAIELNTIC